MFGIQRTLPEKVHDLLSVWQIELTNSETPVGCFHVLSYVNSVAIGVIFIKFWVPQQC